MKRFLSIFLVALFPCACGEPFPNLVGLTNSFIENREEIDALETMLDESKYVAVDLIGETAKGYWFEGEPYPGQVAETERPENASKWVELFLNVDATSIERYDNEELWIPISSEASGHWRRGGASYVYSQNIEKRIKLCKRAFSKVRCGNCIVMLEEDWWLLYQWSPFELGSEFYDDWQEGRITEEEADQLSSQATEACFAEGGTLIDRDGSDR